MPTVTLNPEQQRAVAHRDGPCLVLAGPGSGKTRVIVERFLSLIDAGIAPQRQLVLTYTRKAADEMAERARTALPDVTIDLPLTNYHSFAQRVVREWGWLIGIGGGYRIGDKAEMWLHTEEVLRRLTPPSLWNPLRPQEVLDSLLRLISAAKQELITPDQYLAWATQELEEADEPLRRTLAERHRDAARVYQALVKRCRELAVLDHDDTILYAELLLREHPAARQAVASAIDFVMVDEYQDTNYGQARMVEALVAEHRNLFVVADDDQAIYKFRGASLANLDRFRREYPDHAVIELGRNYRSTPAIVGFSRAVMNTAAADSRLPKTVSPERSGGAPVEIWSAETELDEARALADECGQLIAGGTQPSQIAWLFRRHGDMGPALLALQQQGVPFTVRGGRGFFQRREIKDCLALLHAIADPDDSVSLLRCLQLPAWTVSGAGRIGLVGACRDNDRTLRALIDGAGVADLSESDAAALQQALTDIMALHLAAQRDDVRDVFFDAVERSGFLGIDAIEDIAERQLAGANLNKLAELLESFADWSSDRHITTALRYLTLLRDCNAADEMADPGRTGDGVELLTAHSAKGLEWPVVIISRCTRDRWPGSPMGAGSLQLPDALVPEPPTAGDEHTDEERRLFYVAATRAQDRLILSSADSYPRVYSAITPSPFISDLGLDADTLVRRTVPPGERLPTRRRERNVSAPSELSVGVTDLGTFRQCPRRYAYSARFHLPRRTTVQQWYGTLVHAVLETAARRRQQGEHLDAAAVDALWDQAWEETPGPRGIHADLRSLGAQQLRSYTASEAWTQRGIESVESSFTLKTPDASVRGRFDRIDTTDAGPVVVDYKTGSPRDAKALAGDIQVRTYAVAVSQRENSDRATVELHYVRTGDIVPVHFDSRMLDKAFSHVKMTARDLRSAWATNDFPPRPSGWNCGSCDFRTICDEGRSATD